MAETESTDAVFWLSVEQTGFTSCNHYFGSNDALERKIFLDLKQYREVHILADGFLNKGNEICFYAR